MSNSNNSFDRYLYLKHSTALQVGEKVLVRSLPSNARVEYTTPLGTVYLLTFSRMQGDRGISSYRGELFELDGFTQVVYKGY